MAGFQIPLVSPAAAAGVCLGGALGIYFVERHASNRGEVANRFIRVVPLITAGVGFLIAQTDSGQRALEQLSLGLAYLAPPVVGLVMLATLIWGDIYDHL